MLQAERDGFDNVFADLGSSDKDIEKTANEYHGQSLLPCKSKSEAYRINKESVQTHSRSLCVRNIGHETHYKCSDDRSDDGSQKNCAPFHSGLRKYSRIDNNDVRHGEECRKTGHDFC